MPDVVVDVLEESVAVAVADEESQQVQASLESTTQVVEVASLGSLASFDDDGNLTYDGTTLSINRLNVNGDALASVHPGYFSGSWFTGGSHITTKPYVLIQPDTVVNSSGWNTSGTAFGINAPAAFAGSLLDLRLNGSGIHRFTTTGFQFYSSIALNSSSNVVLRSGGTLGWSNDSTVSTTSSFDVGLSRDTADVLAQRRSTNGQTFRVYGTYTDLNHYVRAALSATSTGISLGAQSGGTGADNVNLTLFGAGTGSVVFGSNLNISTRDVATDASTGSKIGTSSSQKIGFWGATPIARPTTAITEASFIENSGGTPVNADSTFGGYTLQQIAQALKSAGLLT